MRALVLSMYILVATAAFVAVVGVYLQQSAVLAQKGRKRKRDELFLHVHRMLQHQMLQIQLATAHSFWLYSSDATGFWVKPRSSHYWETLMLPHGGDFEFLETFRMDRCVCRMPAGAYDQVLFFPIYLTISYCVLVPCRAAFTRLVTTLHPVIGRRDTRFRAAIDTPRRVAIFLSYVGSALCYRELSSKYGVGLNTAAKIIREVAKAVHDVFKTEQGDLRFPSTAADIKSLEAGFREIWGLPGACGAVDGCHFPIVKPKVDGDNYINRKKWTSIAGTFVASPDLYCLDASVGWPGCVHDARIFKTSGILARLNAGDIPLRSLQTQVCRIIRHATMHCAQFCVCTHA